MRLIKLAQYNQLEALLGQTEELTTDDQNNIENILGLNIEGNPVDYLERVRDEIVFTYIDEMECERHYQEDTGCYNPEVIDQLEIIMNKCVEVIDTRIANYINRTCWGIY